LLRNLNKCQIISRSQQAKGNAALILNRLHITFVQKAAYILNIALICNYFQKTSLTSMPIRSQRHLYTRFPQKLRKTLLITRSLLTRLLRNLNKCQLFMQLIRLLKLLHQMFKEQNFQRCFHLNLVGNLIQPMLKLKKRLMNFPMLLNHVSRKNPMPPIQIKSSTRRMKT
jgi:hypothetical protein